MRIDFDGPGDLARVQAAKTPGWRHGTRKRPNKEKQVKAMKVKQQRAAKRRAVQRAYAKARVDSGCWKPCNP